MLRAGTYLQDRYEILESIGSGGMADVYKAQCHKLNRLVAIKVLKEEFSSDVGFVQKFKLEAQAAAGLSHPNIVNIYDVVDEGSLHFIVMELIEGITLKHYISKKGRLEVKEAVGIAIQVAQGISAAHESNLIHRDIKPQNIIISKDGKAKVADFGIARAATAQTLGSAAMGTVHYISPEQARGGFSDARSDIYSLGITIYEMVTGRVPFEGDNTVTVALAHLEEPITRPSIYNPEVPRSLEAIIMKCTEKQAERRYGSAADVIADLRRVLIHPDEDFVELVPEEPFGQEHIQVKKTGEEIRRTQKTSSALDGDQASSQIEKLMTSAGVFVAIIIVAVLIFVFSRLGGIFRVGPGGDTKSSIQTETVISNEQGEPLGDTEVYVPDVKNLPVDLAEAKLKDSTLVLQVSGYEDSDTVAKGSVISQNPGNGTVVNKYTTVDVIVSNGNNLIDLTELHLMGMDVDVAEVLLKDKKLQVDRKTEYTDTVAEGKLIRYEPMQVKEGESVTLYVSGGPLSSMRTVPKLDGLTEESAQQRLSDAQLSVGEVTSEHSETVKRGLIIRQSVEANTMVKEGSAISYVVSSGSESSQYTASLHEIYNLGQHFGPGAMGSETQIMVRLIQTVGGARVETTLVEAQTMTNVGSYILDLPTIEGAYGVESGTVEIVDVITGNVLKSYPVHFSETEQ